MFLINKVYTFVVTWFCCLSHAKKWYSHSQFHHDIKFISCADSLRLLQHVEAICIPSSWDSLESRSLEDITWDNKQFKVCKFLVSSTLISNFDILHIYLLICSYSCSIMNYHQEGPGLITTIIQVMVQFLVYPLIH